MVLNSRTVHTETQARETILLGGGVSGGGGRYGRVLRKTPKDFELQAGPGGEGEGGALFIIFLIPETVFEYFFAKLSAFRKKTKQ